MATKQNEPTAITVSWEDQKRICNFGRLFKRQKELKEDVEALKQRLEHMGDAETETYIADEVLFTVGESFIKMETDDVLADTVAATEGQLEQVTEELDEIAAVMKELKAELYAKFGSAIYLETDGAQ
eukprot:Rhum_TRINITY_DN3183_c0_g1::Rhum_TRINITY_DN3183_c0_g1_i1::g.9889::m.9889/K09550/PFDN4; prefoldin subunit 4